MQTAEELLKKEFKNTLQERRQTAQLRGLTVPSMPVPQSVLNCELGRKKGTVVKVKDIEVEYFNKLNDTLVTVYEGVKLTKKLIGPDGKVVRLENNKPVYTPVVIPKQCVAIVTSKNINVPVSGYTKTMFYVDCIEGKKKRYYIYVVEKKYLFKANLNALLLSEHKKTNYFKGCKVAFQTGAIGYLYVVPFTSMKEYSTSRILNVKTGLNFDSEIDAILKFWQENKVIFQLNLLSVSETENLGISYFKNQDMIKNYREFKGVYK